MAWDNFTTEGSGMFVFLENRLRQNHTTYFQLFSKQSNTGTDVFISDKKCRVNITSKLNM